MEFTEPEDGVEVARSGAADVVVEDDVVLGGSWDVVDGGSGMELEVEVVVHDSEKRVRVANVITVLRVSTTWLVSTIVVNPPKSRYTAGRIQQYELNKCTNTRTISNAPSMTVEDVSVTGEQDVTTDIPDEPRVGPVAQAVVVTKKVDVVSGSGEVSVVVVVSVSAKKLVEEPRVSRHHRISRQGALQRVNPGAPNSVWVGTETQSAMVETAQTRANR